MHSDSVTVHTARPRRVCGNKLRETHVPTSASGSEYLLLISMSQLIIYPNKRKLRAHHIERIKLHKRSTKYTAVNRKLKRHLDTNSVTSPKVVTVGWWTVNLLAYSQWSPDVSTCQM